MSQPWEHSIENIELTGYLSRALATIETSVEQIYDQAMRIATASGQLRQMAEQINQNVMRVVDAAWQSDTGVGQTHEANHEPVRWGGSLRHLAGNVQI